MGTGSLLPARPPIRLVVGQAGRLPRELGIVIETLFRRIPGLRLTVGMDEVPFKYDSTICVSTNCR